jgi:AraC family transcriptional activator of tynA and feaB
LSQKELKLNNVANHRFSTEDVHPRDRVSYMQDVACRTYVEVGCHVANHADFFATIISSQLATIGLSRVKTDPCIVSRTKSNIHGTRSDDILLSLQLEGHSKLEQDNRQALLGPGEFAFYDTERPYELHTERGTSQIVLKIPRASLEARLGSLSNLTAHTLSSSNPLSSIAFEFLKQLPGKVETLAPAPAQLLAERALDILTLAVTTESKTQNIYQSGGRLKSLLRLKSVINNHANDPEFRPKQAAQYAGISVLYANQLLSDEGTTLEQYIYAQRLEICRKRLADPHSQMHSITEIAHANGFNCAAHFSRKCKEAFGQSPKAYRAEQKLKNSVR